MIDDTTGGTQFTEAQVSAILKRAAELQAARSAGGSDAARSGGTSLDQLQQAAAAEIGIDPALV